MTDLITANGSPFKIPLHDHVVRTRVESGHSMIGELLRQIQDEGLYSEQFKGKSGLTFLDLGANIGLVSLYASPCCRRIVSVEPDPQTFEVLKRMVSKFNHIEPFCAALSPSNGECIFYQNDINSTASSTVNTHGNRISVRGMTLTSILRELNLSKVDFCKIDCEGAEGESLSLAEFEGARTIVSSYFIETHNCPKTPWEHKLGCIVGNLSRCGYHYMEIKGMGVLARRAK